MKDKARQEVVKESVNLISQAIKQMADAEEALERCGIKFCSYKFPGTKLYPEFQIQVYSGIKDLADCLGEKVDNPWIYGEPESNKLFFTHGGIHFLQVGKARGFDFE